MADFISSSSSSPLPLTLTMSHISTPSSSAPFDDSSEDACSICLEPFSTHDPATITSCKHEYHLHCILEWSQRSKECPICWQLLILKDPASQELLKAVEAEKPFSSRTVYSHAFTDSCGPLQRLNSDQDDSCSDDSDFDEQLMQHLVSSASRARYICRRERQQRSPGAAGPSDPEVLVFNSATATATATVMHASGMMQPTLTTTSPTSVGMVTTNTSSESDMPSKPRVIYSQPSPSEMFSFPESFKSKLSAASARCKESISKNSRGLKEKLIARNASVKELSKGVQREMNAGIAGVARMIERLDLTSKRSSTPLIPVQENVTTSNASSLDSTLVAVGVETPPSCLQSGHDAVRT